MKDNHFARFRTIGISILLLFAIVSMTLIKGITTSDAIQLPVIESLTQKQSIITKVVISSAAASVLIAAVPDDSTTPIANQIADMSSYLLFAQIVLLIEKYLYGVAGFCSWGILFPAAAVLFAFYRAFNKKPLKTLASRIALFATCIYFLVPISVRVDGIYREYISCFTNDK